MSTDTLIELIRNYGYLSILIGTFFEGETILLLGGFAAHLGYLEVPWVIASGLCGSFCGDQLFYYIGRHYGPKIITRRLSWQERAERVYEHLHRHKNLLILTFRFFYGLRNVTPFVIGAAHVSRARFFMLNLAGAVLWAISFGYAGFLFGAGFRLVLADFALYETYVLFALALLGFVVWLAALVRSRRKARERGLG
jgi:membrane protein DedA with SNARE-associated domain